MIVVAIFRLLRRLRQMSQLIVARNQPAQERGDK